LKPKVLELDQTWAACWKFGFFIGLYSWGEREKEILGQEWKEESAEEIWRRSDQEIDEDLRRSLDYMFC